MKLSKRILLVILSAIIISLNICIFAMKPLEIKANEVESAIAIPFVAEVLFSLLMSAGVAVGAYDIMNNAQTQKELYNDFLQSVKDGTLTIPDTGEIDIQTPTIKVGKFWLNDLDSLEKLMGWTPPTPEQPPEDPDKPPRDEDYWQQLGKQSSFKVNGEFLSKFTEYFTRLFEDTSNPLSQKIFHPQGGGFSGIDKNKVNGMYEYNFTSQELDSYDNIVKFKGFYHSYEKLAGVLATNGTQISAKYLNTAYDIISARFPTMFYQTVGSSVWIDTSGSQIIPCNVSYNIPFPVFSTLESAEKYLRTGSLKGCLNLDPLIDYQVGIARLPNTLKPAIGTRVPTKALIDTMKKTKTAVQTEPQMETETYIDTFEKTLEDTVTTTPLPQPEFTPTTPPTYPEIGTDIPDIPDDKKDTLRDWSRIFPFCIPFDIVDILRVLEAEPKAPRFEFDFKIDLIDYEQIIVIDLSTFDDVAKIVRMCELMLFLVGLGVATRGLIKW